MLNCSVRISGIKDGTHEYFFNIDNQFFEAFVNSEVTDSKIKVSAILLKDLKKLKLSLKISGNISNLICDLCASKISIPVSNTLSVLIEETDLNQEDTDEVIYVSPSQHTIDISQLIYECIIFSIPIKREHSGGKNDKCDKNMKILIDQYTKQKKISDPQWSELNKLKDLI